MAGARQASELYVWPRFQVGQQYSRASLRHEGKGSIDKGRNSLVASGGGLCSLIGRGVGSIPSQGTKIPQAKKRFFQKGINKKEDN